jgi:hypothetical protein
MHKGLLEHETTSTNAVEAYHRNLYRHIEKKSTLLDGLKVKKPQTGDAGLQLARWHANSCFIDATVEFVQRVIFPDDRYPTDDKDNGCKVTHLINSWKHILLTEGEVQATWAIRLHFWKYNPEIDYGIQNDCCNTYHYLTDQGPLEKLLSFHYCLCFFYKLVGKPLYGANIVTTLASDVSGLPL